MTAIAAIAVALVLGLCLVAWARRWSKRTAARLIYGDRHPAHVHGAWCHPSADGCPDRPGM